MKTLFPIIIAALAAMALAAAVSTPMMALSGPSAQAGHHHDDPDTPQHDHGPHDMAEEAPSSQTPPDANDMHGAAEPSHDHADGAAATDNHHGPDSETTPDRHADQSAMIGHSHNDTTGAADHHGEAEGAGGHFHWGDHGPQTELEQTIANIGVLHSLAVHFPIALALAATLAQILFLVTGQASLAHTVRFLAWTAALGGLAAGLLGWAHAGPVATGEAGVMAWHRWIGTGLTFGLFAVAGAAEWHQRQPSSLARWSLTLLVLTAALAVSVNGFLGGALAHGGLRHLIGG